MFKTHKRTLILSSVVTLLPMLAGLLLWNKLPQVEDGWSPSHFTVFGIPLIMLAADWVCILVTCLDRTNDDRNRKVQSLVLWIIPVMSIFVSATTYALMLGIDFDMERVMLIVLGLMFLVLGNYLPKCRMNSTIGIKVPWAYTSEENWNATHRLGGKIWVIGGLLIALSAFLPGDLGIWVLLIAMLLLAVIPVVYSYKFYKKQRQDPNANVIHISTLFGLHSRKTAWSLILVVLILVGVAFLMFTGDIEMQYGSDSFTIEASYYDDLTISYADIDSIEYRDGNISGSRTMGFGSARLLMGLFANEEFGTYTRYTYGNPGACVVLTVGEKTLVISGEDTASTRAIYDTLVSQVP